MAVINGVMLIPMITKMDNVINNVMIMTFILMILMVIIIADDGDDSNKYQVSL